MQSSCARHAEQVRTACRAAAHGMHSGCARHAQRLRTACRAAAHGMQSSCAQHAKHLRTACRAAAHGMQSSCARHAEHLRTACRAAAHGMQSSCTRHAVLLVRLSLGVGSVLACFVVELVRSLACPSAPSPGRSSTRLVARLPARPLARAPCDGSRKGFCFLLSLPTFLQISFYFSLVSVPADAQTCKRASLIMWSPSLHAGMRGMRDP